MRCLRLLTLLLLTLLTAFSGCLRVPALHPSLLFETFNPPEIAEKELRFQAADPIVHNLTNTDAGFAWKEWAGTITPAVGTPGTHLFYKALRDSINKGIGGQCTDEGTLAAEAGPHTQPARGLMKYETHGRRGEVHVWLFPNADETSISYAVFLREEPVR